MKIISGILRSFYKDDFMLLNQEYLSKFEASRWTVLTHNKNYEVSLQRKKTFSFSKEDVQPTQISQKELNFIAQH